jgi:hypothetical protein
MIYPKDHEPLYYTGPSRYECYFGLDGIFILFLVFRKTDFQLDNMYSSMLYPEKEGTDLTSTTSTIFSYSILKLPRAGSRTGIDVFYIVLN